MNADIRTLDPTERGLRILARMLQEAAEVMRTLPTDAVGERRAVREGRDAA